MQEVPFFAQSVGFDADAWQQALRVWHARRIHLVRGQYLISVGDAVRDLFVVVSGRIHMAVDDYWGNRSVLSEVDEGHILGAAYAFGDATVYPICAEAVRESVVVAIPVAEYRASFAVSPELYVRAQSAFLQALANRSIGLIHTIEQVKQRTLRQKILAYLSHRSRLVGSVQFDVPLTRQQMADYLAVDRSALSRELSHLRAEGVLDYRRQHFTLYLPQSS